MKCSPSLLRPSSLRAALALAGLIAGLLVAAAHGASAAKRPNIIFVLTDDQRWDSLGLTGNAVVKTPNLDQLAAEGVWFEQATVASAICTPSRASYFLGQYERRHGVNFNSGTSVTPEAWAKSYPVLLREAGYFTGYVGKNHVPVGAKGYATGLIEQSFDYWFASHNALGFYPKKRHPIFQRARADTQIEIIAEGAKNFLAPEESFIAGADRFLAQRPADRPFCLTIAFNVPHAAGTSSMEQRPDDPELYRTTYRDQLARQPIPSTYIAKADIRTPKLPPDLLFTQYRQSSYNYVDTEATLRERQIREYQTITGIDRLVGAIRAQLASLGVAGNTVIVFASDHGITHGEFGLGGKALNYESCLRIPMIAYDPRIAKRVKAHHTPALVQSVDVAPTLLDLAGLPVPAVMQGLSFRAALAGEPFAGRSHAFAENLWSTISGNPRCETVRTADWKYTRYFANDRSPIGQEGRQGEGGAVSDALAARYAHWLIASINGEKPVYEELFHLRNDPEETTNLAHDSRHATVLRDLRARCQQLVTEAKGDVSTPPATVRVQGAREARGHNTKQP
jgi:arylsulfatase A-like enzyme